MSRHGLNPPPSGGGARQSQCVRVGPFVYIAGQCGLGPDHEIVSADFAEQARAALDRVRAAVEAAGGGLDDIVAMTVFITDTRLGRVFTSMRRDYFGDRFPAGALIGVSALMVPGALIEIQATAVLSRSAAPIPGGRPRGSGQRWSAP